MKVPDSVYETVRNLDPGEHYMVILKTPLRAGETRPFVAMAKMDLPDWVNSPDFSAPVKTT